jgi:hypothetical protein
VAPSQKERYRAAAIRENSAESTDIPIGEPHQSDAEAWIALMWEHRLRIAVVLGAHPSQVKIQVGHC